LSRLAIGATSSTRHSRLISVDEGMTSSVASQLPAGVKRNVMPDARSLVY
jgi:hypothetical protein